MLTRWVPISRIEGLESTKLRDGCQFQPLATAVRPKTKEIHKHCRFKRMTLL